MNKEANRSKIYPVNSGASVKGGSQMENKRLAIAWGTVGVMLVGCLAVAGFNKVPPEDAAKLNGDRKELLAAQPAVGLPDAASNLLQSQHAVSAVDAPVSRSVAGTQAKSSALGDANGTDEKGSSTAHGSNAEVLMPGSSDASATEEVDPDLPSTDALSEALELFSPESRPDVVATSDTIASEPNQFEVAAAADVATGDTLKEAVDISIGNADPSVPKETPTVRSLSDAIAVQGDAHATSPVSEPVRDKVGVMKADAFPIKTLGSGDALPEVAGDLIRGVSPEQIAQVIGGEQLEVPSGVSSSSVDPKPFFGVGIRGQNSNRITTLYAGSTAAKLGVKIGDRLVSVNNRAIGNIQSLQGALIRMQVGEMTTVMLIRDGVNYELGPIPLQKR